MYINCWRARNIHAKKHKIQNLGIEDLYFFKIFRRRLKNDFESIVMTFKIVKKCDQIKMKTH